MSGAEPYALLRMKKANDEAARLAREEGGFAPIRLAPRREAKHAPLARN